MADDDVLDPCARGDDDLVKQIQDDLYDGLEEEVEEGVNILLERDWAPYNVLTEALVEGMGSVGIDNSVEGYLEALKEQKPDILGISALLTITLPCMKVVIDALKEKGIRDDDVVLVGGASLNEAFSEAIGADA